MSGSYGAMQQMMQEKSNSESMAENYDQSFGSMGEEQSQSEYGSANKMGATMNANSAGYGKQQAAMGMKQQAAGGYGAKQAAKYEEPEVSKLSSCNWDELGLLHSNRLNVI